MRGLHHDGKTNASIKEAFASYTQAFQSNGRESRAIHYSNSHVPIDCSEELPPKSIITHVGYLHIIGSKTLYGDHGQAKLPKRTGGSDGGGGTAGRRLSPLIFAHWRPVEGVDNSTV